MQYLLYTYFMWIKHTSNYISTKYNYLISVNIYWSITSIGLKTIILFKQILLYEVATYNTILFRSLYILSLLIKAIPYNFSNCAYSTRKRVLCKSMFYSMIVYNTVRAFEKNIKVVNIVCSYSVLYDYKIF